MIVTRATIPWTVLCLVPTIALIMVIVCRASAIVLKVSQGKTVQWKENVLRIVMTGAVV